MDHEEPCNVNAVSYDKNEIMLSRTNFSDEGIFLLVLDNFG